MSRIDRLREYEQIKGPRGAGRDIANIDAFANRASANSQLAPRASAGPMKLPSTKVNVRDSSMSPKVSRNVESAMRAGKRDLNFVGSSDFMPKVRRTTT